MGIEAEDVALRRPTLDEVFLALTGRPADGIGPAGPAPPEVEVRMSVALEPFIPARRQRVRWGLSDTWTITRRDLIQWFTQPWRIVGELVFPIMFVLLFGYVFGSGIVVPGGGDYREFLMPGLFAMTMAFGIGNTMTVVATDVERGVMDRFRSMPMAPSAVVAGRCCADMANSFAGLAITIACGLVVGWSWHDGLPSARSPRSRCCCCCASRACGSASGSG